MVKTIKCTLKLEGKKNVEKTIKCFFKLRGTTREIEIVKAKIAALSSLEEVISLFIQENFEVWEEEKEGKKKNG